MLPMCDYKQICGSYLNVMHSKSVHIILAVTFDCVLDSLLKLVARLHFFLTLVTAIGSRPKPELCFLLGRLM